MRARTVAAVALGVFGLASTAAADAPTLWTSAEVKWSDVAEPPGARQASLWSDPATGDRGTLVRWKFNTTNPARVAEADTHIVILAGTFTFDVEGSAQKQFGPGGFLSIPKGTSYKPGCEAAGECIFVLHQPGLAPAR